MEDIKRCISRKDYLSKYDSNVGYALYVQDNIKKDDYARLNIGQIVKVIEIRENNVNKKAIYYNVFNEDWFDAMAVENFSDNLIDLIEVGDYVNGNIVTDKYLFAGEKPVIEIERNDTNCKCLCEKDIKSILTHEVFEANAYKVKGE